MPNSTFAGSVRHAMSPPDVHKCPPYLSVSQYALCRQQIAASIKEQYASFGRWLAPHQLPVVYNDVYNVSFMGIENLHVFDSKKFRKVVASLEREQLLKRNQVGTVMGTTQSTDLDVLLHACAPEAPVTPATLLNARAICKAIYACHCAMYTIRDRSTLGH